MCEIFTAGCMCEDGHHFKANGTAGDQSAVDQVPPTNIIFALARVTFNANLELR